MCLLLLVDYPLPNALKEVARTTSLTSLLAATNHFLMTLKRGAWWFRHYLMCGLPTKWPFHTSLHPLDRIQRERIVLTACMCMYLPCVAQCDPHFQYDLLNIVPHHLPVCLQLHTDSPVQLDYIWTWSSAHVYGVRQYNHLGGLNSGCQLSTVQCSTD